MMRGYPDYVAQVLGSLRESVRDRFTDAHRSGRHPREHVNERHLHCVWYDHLFRREGLHCEAGQPIEVLFPGIWNRSGAGPDFSHAALMIGGRQTNGDVEVHVYSNDWNRHGHGSDPRFGSVVLHVALWDDRSGPGHVDARGKKIPLLILSRFLDRGIEELADSLDLSQYPQFADAGSGFCRGFVRRSPSARSQMEDMVRLAGEWRLRRKISRFAEWLRAVSPEEALYRGLMGALGYRANRQYFDSIAQRLPLRSLRALARERSGATPPEEAAECALLWCAGLGRQAGTGGSRDDVQTAKYLRLLPAVGLDEPTGRAMPVRHATRPAHTPERRLAGAARLFCGGSGDQLFDDLVEIASVDVRGGPAGSVSRDSVHVRLARRLRIAPAGYLSKRVKPGRHALRGGTALLGDQWARIAIVNVVFPLLVARARHNKDGELERRVQTHLRQMRAVPENASIRLARHRIFGPGSRVGERRLAATVIGHLGFVQFHDDFCGRGWAGCSACPVSTVLRVRG
ncbi:MAG: DUF2851 family protein [Planctomycetota bacterium]|nr:DUF2851 family protein [Planctomycetota bacterium]